MVRKRLVFINEDGSPADLFNVPLASSVDMYVKAVDIIGDTLTQTMVVIETRSPEV
jgi:hypothetical protein